MRGCGANDNKFFFFFFPVIRMCSCLLLSERHRFEGVALIFMIEIITACLVAQ